MVVAIFHISSSSPGSSDMLIIRHSQCKYCSWLSIFVWRRLNCLSNVDLPFKFRDPPLKTLDFFFLDNQWFFVTLPKGFQLTNSSVCLLQQRDESMRLVSALGFWYWFTLCWVFVRCDTYFWLFFLMTY